MPIKVEKRTVISLTSNWFLQFLSWGAPHGLDLEFYGTMGLRVPDHIADLFIRRKSDPDAEPRFCLFPFPPCLTNDELEDTAHTAIAPGRSSPSVGQY